MDLRHCILLCMPLLATVRAYNFYVLDGRISSLEVKSDQLTRLIESLQRKVKKLAQTVSQSSQNAMNDFYASNVENGLQIFLSKKNYDSEVDKLKACESLGAATFHSSPPTNAELDLLDRMYMRLLNTNEFRTHRPDQGAICKVNRGRGRRSLRK